MLKIRMQRIGKINQPSFRIVVVEHAASPKAGSFVDKVGTYNPKTKERTLDEGKIKYWISVGAKPSATVHNMLVSLGVVSGKKINVLPAYKAPGEQAPVNSEQQTPVEVPAEEAKAEAETVAVEAKTE